MKCFHSFRLDTADQCLWRGQERVSIPPKAFDVLRYLVENPVRLVTQDELLEKLWPETYVNPEAIRKYILDIRKTLGDRPDRPEFIETVTKRGYRFIATVTDDSTPPESDSATHTVPTPQTAPAKLTEWRQRFRSHYFQMIVVVPTLAVVAVGATAGHFWFSPKKATLPPLTANSIAVLPFVDVSPGKDQEYFSDGLSEQLIHELAKVSGLKVVGRSSAFQFKGKNEDLRNVGHRLGVANVLEGSVRREGNHVRITAELVKVDDGFQLWSQSYDRQINDIFAVQDEIARAATVAIQPKLLGSGQALPSTGPLHSVNPEAYQAYLQANYFWGRGTGEGDVTKALAYADQAIRLDEKYAPAWALRASVLNAMAESGLADVTDGFRKARDDAERSIALDPTSASAYLALARTQIYHDWDWETANTCLEKAATLEPGNAEVFRARSYLARALGNLDEAVKLYEQAVPLDPLRANSHLGLGYLLYMAGRFKDGQASLEKALDLNPQAAFAHADLSKILLAEGKPQQALAEIEKEPNDWEKLTDQAMIYHALGREQDSNSALAELRAKHRNDSAYQIAEVYAFRSQSGKSFEWLERAYKQRDAGLPDIKVDPVFSSLRRDARYIELLKQLRLPT
jgi:TolB-like protein/DNA-binding winged helix-turn-helix (wHTH) protein/Flp pilus assembly protein TadD